MYNIGTITFDKSVVGMDTYAKTSSKGVVLGVRSATLSGRGVNLLCKSTALRNRCARLPIY